jgi:DNA-binding CsgD family transcriptional regulator
MGVDAARERYTRLTPREARVLVLLLDGATTQEIAGILGVGRGTVNGVRQSIRRKLAIPAHADLGDSVTRLPGIRDHLRQVAEPVVVPHPAPDRRRNLVLRAALRDIDGVATRAAAKSRALVTLAAASDDHDRRWMLAEAEQVAAIATELADLHDRAVALAREPVHIDLSS